MLRVEGKNSELRCLAFAQCTVPRGIERTVLDDGGGGCFDDGSFVICCCLLLEPEDICSKRCCLRLHCVEKIVRSAKFKYASGVNKTFNANVQDEAF